MTTYLSKNFSLQEMIATQHREIDNTPPLEIVDRLTHTAEAMEEVRHLLGDRVITVSSGYRCPELNAAVGGALTSAHMFGYAVDFNCYGFGDPLEVCRALAAAEHLKFDQVIQESTWSHISFDPRMRRNLLTAQRGHYLQGLVG